jgi:VanZ family protein
MARRSKNLEPSRLLIFYWLPVVAYLACIFTLSAQPNLQPPIQFTLSDKVYHLFEYGGLGLLLARAVGATLPAVSPNVIVFIALSLGIAIGTSDEVFQASVPGRDSSGFDLLADTAGLTLAQILYRLIVRG